jgi:hypothetical protein
MKEDFDYQMKTPNISTYIAFSRAIAGCRYKRDFINRWFNKLVDSSDYLKSEKSELLNQLVKISNSEIE